MNITDVGHLVADSDDGEDKIEKEARKTRRNAKDIAREYEAEFRRDSKALGILPPSKYPRATSHIPEQIALIKKLEQLGFTYQTDDGIYFDTKQAKDYGKLDPKNIKGIKAGARVEHGNKKNITDFALWKFSQKTGPKREMEWKSPWGVGFPGWHIECSAMSMKYLGETLDIHCGGIDHIQIHHTNEIAQSESATRKPFSRFWMHGAFLTIHGERMEKSSPDSNITVATLREKGFDPLDFRYLALGTHYRKPLSFTWEALESARNARLKILSLYRNLPSKPEKNEESQKEKILEALSDDLNVPKALAFFFDGIKKGFSKDFVLWADHVFGLRIKQESYIPKNILDLVTLREKHRQEKNYAKSDEIRAELLKKRFRVEDTPSGPVVHKI